MAGKVRIYGKADQDKAPSESVEMSTFFSRLRAQYPHTYGAVGIHVRNEGKRTFAQASKMMLEGGFVKGTPDIIIPGSPTFLCELKSRKKGSRPSKEQMAYLETATKTDAFCVIAYGYEEAWNALNDWIESMENTGDPA